MTHSNSEAAKPISPQEAARSIKERAMTVATESEAATKQSKAGSSSSSTLSKVPAANGHTATSNPLAGGGGRNPLAGGGGRNPLAGGGGRNPLAGSGGGGQTATRNPLAASQANPGPRKQASFSVDACNTATANEDSSSPGPITRGRGLSHEHISKVKALRDKQTAEAAEARRVQVEKQREERVRTGTSGHAMALRTQNPLAAMGSPMSANTPGKPSNNPLAAKGANAFRPALHHSVSYATPRSGSGGSSVRKFGANKTPGSFSSAPADSDQIRRKGIHTFQFQARYRFLKTVPLLAKLSTQVIGRLAGTLDIVDFE